MALAERQLLPVPTGQHVYVLSDLSLSPTTDIASRPIDEFINLLGDIDDAATVVIAGNFFHPEPTSDLAKFIDATFQHLPQLRNEIQAFTAKEGHRFIVLPGTDDAELRDDERAQLRLEAFGISIASDLILQVATASGVRDLAVAAGSAPVDLDLADRADRADADRLEDPQALARFVSSRVLYRRLGKWIWIPLVVMALIDFASTLQKILNHFTKEHLTLHALHATGFWSSVVLNLLFIGILEAFVVGAAALIVRRRFDRSAHVLAAQELSEPLSLTKVDDVDALEYARRIAERGGAGAIIGGAPRPALAFLDRGVSAAPGPSRTVIVERRGRFGLPPVFGSVVRLGIVEVEAASAVQVRLYAGETPRPRGTFIERVIAGTDVQPAPPERTTTVGSWPSGDPFPVTVELLTQQRRQRSIRRIASGLLFLDGLINLIVTASPPLRSRLHSVLSILPLGAAQSAAAVTAVAGIALIMMARGIRRGQRRSWWVAVAALAITIVAHLARGGGFASSFLAAVILGLLVFQRRHFQATTDRASVKTALPRLVSIGVLTIGTAVLGVEAAGRHNHLPNLGRVTLACAERLIGITAIPLPDRASDFVNPSLFAVGISLLISVLYVLTRPVVDRRLSTSGSTAERRIAELRAREIVRRHGRGTLDYFALRDDKQFFFFRDSLVAYAVYGGVALISPDPIGPEAERTEVFSAFRTYAEARGWTIGIMGASEEWLPIYHAAGLHYLYLGDEAIVDAQTFTLEGGKMKGLRQACTRMLRNGYTVSFVDPAKIDPSQVTEILDLISMLRRGDAERGFSMSLGRLFNPKDKGLLLTIVRGPDGKPAAACQFVPSPAINGYSLDLMRRDPGEHPNGLIDFALCSTIEYMRENGGRGLSLNFAAFRSVIDGERGEGTFTRVERWALKRLSGVLPIESLWSFNSKYYPTWLPRHLVYPAAESFVPVVAAIFRAESITELPIFGRFLTNDPTNRPGTVVPEEVLEAASRVDATSTN